MNHSPETRIDQVLQALRNTEAPNGLEQRVSARLEQLSQAQGNRTSSATFLDLLRLPLIPAAAYPIAIAALAIIGAGTLISHRKPHTIAINTPTSATTQIASQPHSTKTVSTQPSPTSAPGKHFVLNPAAPQPLSNPSDPDAIALAETLAPSHPTPPLPITPQEALLLRSARRGQPIEIAELETRRESVLNHIAEARERTSIREYIHGLLGPLATAESLTPSPAPPEDAQPIPEPEPPPSN
jgi:hypothetical protein